MPAVENSLGPYRKPKSTISGWTLVNGNIPQAEILITGLTRRGKEFLHHWSFSWGKFGEAGPVGL